MTVLNAGTSLTEAVTWSGAGNTTSGTLDTYVSEAILFADPAVWVDLWEGSDITELWILVGLWDVLTGIEASRTPFVFKSNGVNHIRVLTGTPTVVQYWNGSTWVALTPTSTFSAITGDARYDVGVKIDAVNGYIRVYQNKVLLYEYVGNTVFNSVTTVDGARIMGIDGSNSFASAWVIADEDTRPLRYAQLTASGAGAVSEWDGATANVTGIPGWSDSTVMTTNVYDEVQLFALANLNAAFNTGWTVETVVVAVRAAREVGKVADLRIVAQSGAERADGSRVSLGSTFVGYVQQFTTDPVTDLPWAIAAVNALEVGVQALEPL
jgi:hypothetical protein